LALILKTSTRRCTQLKRSSIEASRCGMSFSISRASIGRPNSMVAEIRESVAVKGATMSGAKGGLSAANAVEHRPRRPSAARPARADPCKVIRER
jgi:hypothetical protein